MNVTKFYRCHNCFSLYDSIDDAQVCCEPEMRYHCGECGHYHSDEIKAETIVATIKLSHIHKSPRTIRIKDNQRY